MTVKGGRKGGSKATSRKVKSKEIIDDVASDESSGGVGGNENSVDAKRKRQSYKSKPGSVDKNGKPSRKRQTKNKVCEDFLCVTATIAVP